MSALANAPSVADRVSSQDSTVAPVLVPEPQSVEETGIEFDRLADLALKTFSVAGSLAARDLGEQMALPVFLAQEIVDHLRRLKLVDVTLGPDRSERLQRFALTNSGSDKAHGLLQRNRYVGPAPVPLETYCEVVQAGARKKRPVDHAALEEAFATMTIAPEIIDLLGPAICAGRSLFIFGAPGNGKTTLAEAIGGARGGNTLVPYAIEAKGEIIRVFDASLHIPADRAPAATDSSGDPDIVVLRSQRHDQRWSRVRRPLVVAGGELTLERLELSHSPANGIHQAPSQLKANGGTFLLDDFGRQRVSPSELFNRWIVPLERGVDYLHLASGDVIEVPFDALLIFATNLEPRNLVDEAFLRRIKYTVELPDPTPAQFHEIFRGCCARAGITYRPELIDAAIEHFYRSAGRPMRGCHPRDLVERICDRASYEGRPPRLDEAALHRACEGYFQLRG